VKFDDLDREMRVFETANDRCVLPGIYMVARIDGRNFTRLSKERHKFEAPFDIRFRDCMLQTVEHVMNCGFRVIYGYTQSDEISLLFNLNDDSFGRKTRKFNSILAGEASAKFSLLLNDVAAFDRRICELPGAQRVRDYFRWRQEDAHRNALSAHCYWMLRGRGLGVAEATTELRGMGVAEKNELLFQHGLNFNDLPSWQKRGVGLLWENFQRSCRRSQGGRAGRGDPPSYPPRLGPTDWG
jgi:tRNA(His) guanylyltransferase